MSKLPDPFCYLRTLPQDALDDVERAYLTYVMNLEQRIAELEDKLHEIYSRACMAMGEDDDLLLWKFAQEARDIALRREQHQRARRNAV